MKILLYGGTFDPPHYGHLNNLRAAASRVQPDEIVVMPAGVSPFKQMSATPGALRAEMCGCFAEAVQGPRAAARALHVSTWEIEQAAAGRRNYTVLTLEMLARQYPGAELYLAIGSDMLLSFDGWHRWQDILRLAHLVVTSSWTPAGAGCCLRRSRRCPWPAVTSVPALQGAKAVKTNSRLWSSASSRGRASTGQREIEPIP